MTTDVRKVGIVGTGVIGASWAAYYLARGFDVHASDPGEGAEQGLRAQVAGFWPALQRMGLAPDAAQHRLHFDKDLAQALKGVDFVQENGPERVDIKRDLLARITAAIGPDVIVATSSSGILISEVQDAANHPERIVLGHPFNPPHLIPLVEVVGGRLTSAQAIERTMAFYAAIGKKPILLRREIKGHIANRLQAALWREAFSLIGSGVASVADVDTAISHGPGLRWALLGPFMNLHLSGGTGGMAHVIEHLGPPIEGWWRDLGELSAFTPDLTERAVAGVEQELGGRDARELAQARDQILIGLLEMKAAQSRLP